jgi:myo-inositol-hexaphosphate 3-phosphohydrolase
VADGGGQVQLAAVDGTDQNSKLALRTVDPSQGFSMVFADENAVMPIRMSNLQSIYFGVDGNGRLLVAVQLPSSYVIQARKQDPSGIDFQLSGWIIDIIRNSIIGAC